MGRVERKGRNGRKDGNEGGRREKRREKREKTHNEPRSQAHSDGLVGSPVPSREVNDVEGLASDSGSGRFGAGRSPRRGRTGSRVGCGFHAVALVVARGPRTEYSTENSGEDHHDGNDGRDNPPKTLLVAFLADGGRERRAVGHAGGFLAFVEVGGGVLGRVAGAGEEEGGGRRAKGGEFERSRSTSVLRSLPELVR
jgi:hypothetical protein